MKTSFICYIKIEEVFVCRKECILFYENSEYEEGNLR